MKNIPKTGDITLYILKLIFHKMGIFILLKPAAKSGSFSKGLIILSI